MPDFDSNVKKNVDKWIIALVEKTRLTNDMPEKDRKKAEKYASLCTALLELKNVTEMQYSKRGSLKRMNDESYRTLNDAYEKVGRLCEEYFSTPDVSNSQETYNLMQEMSAELAEDMNSLQQYNNLKEIGGKKEAVSFQILIDNGRPREITIDNAKVTRLGGNMSKRVAFHYKSLDGRDLNGVFTEKSIFSPEQQEQEGRANYDRQYSEVMTLFRDAYDAYASYVKADDGTLSLKEFYRFFRDANDRNDTSRGEKTIKNYLKEYYENKNDKEKLALLNKYSASNDVFTDVFKCFSARSYYYLFNNETLNASLKKDLPSWTDCVKESEEKHAYMKLVFEKAYPAYRYINNLEKDTYEEKTAFYQEVCSDEYLTTGMSSNTLVNMVTTYLGADPKTKEMADGLRKMNLDTDLEFKILMKSFWKHCFSMGMQIGVNGINLGFEDKARVDTRNTGMSLVADMLGRPELIAHAQPLKLKLGDKLLEGTFMDLGNGTDVTRLKGNNDVKKYNTKTFQTNALRSVSDLMVIDFICGNVDRHGANMVYQFDTRGDAYQHRFMGVQGIDNDASFGVINHKSTMSIDAIMQFPYIYRMKVISQSMAEKVLKLKTSELKFRLRGQGLTDKQLNAAGERLKYLQTKIKNDIQHFNLNKGQIPTDPADPDFIVNNRIRIVPDNDFHKLHLDLLDTDRAGSRSYYHALRIFEHDHYQSDFEKEQLNPQIANAAEEDFGDYGDHISPEYAAKAAAQLKKMEKVTKPNKTSKEFEDLRTAVTEYSDFCSNYTELPLTEKEYSQRAKLLNNIATAALKYLSHKKHCLWVTDYAQKRIDLVTEMSRQFTQGSLKATAAHYGVNSPELQKKIDEYNERRIELLDCRIKDDQPALRLEIDEMQANKAREKAAGKKPNAEEDLNIIKT